MKKWEEDVLSMSLDSLALAQFMLNCYLFMFSAHKFMGRWTNTLADSAVAQSETPQDKLWDNCNIWVRKE